MVKVDKWGSTGMTDELFYFILGFVTAGLMLLAGVALVFA